MNSALVSIAYLERILLVSHASTQLVPFMVSEFVASIPSHQSLVCPRSDIVISGKHPEEDVGICFGNQFCIPSLGK